MARVTRRHRSPLQEIPGVGPNIAIDLEELGYRTVPDLIGEDPQAMYDRLGALRGPQDRCVLYVFRCAVYYATTPDPEPHLLRWWAWKTPRSP